MTNRYAAFIGLYQSQNVTIRGSGIIDGQGFIWWERSGRLPGHPDTLKHTRGRMIEPMYSSDLTIVDITIKNGYVCSLFPFISLNLNFLSNGLITRL